MEELLSLCERLPLWDAARPRLLLPSLPSSSFSLSLSPSLSLLLLLRCEEWLPLRELLPIELSL